MPLLTRWALLYDTTSDVDASVQWASTLVLPAVSLCYIASRRRAFWYLSSSLDTPRRCALSLAATHRLATAVRLVALLVLVACVNARVVVSYTHLLPVQGIKIFFSTCKNYVVNNMIEWIRLDGACDVFVVVGRSSGGCVVAARRQQRVATHQRHTAVDGDGVAVGRCMCGGGGSAHAVVSALVASRRRCAAGAVSFRQDVVDVRRRVCDGRRVVDVARVSRAALHDVGVRRFDRSQRSFVFFSHDVARRRAHRIRVVSSCHRVTAPLFCFHISVFIDERRVLAQYHSDQTSVGSRLFTLQCAVNDASRTTLGRLYAFH